MKLPEDIRQYLLRKYCKQNAEWLLSSKNQWPIKISLGIPTEHIALRQPDTMRNWVTAWQQWQGPGQLTWSIRNWKVIGSQRLPDKLILETPEEVAAWIGELFRWRQAKKRFINLTASWPALSKPLLSYFDVLADYDEIDFCRLRDLVTWISINPNSNLYPRQLPIVGIHSKWLENRKKLIGDLVAAILVNKESENDFYQRCGLKTPPRLLRMRILDEKLRNQIGGLGDISAPIEYLAVLKLAVSRAIIVENLQTGLAFSDMTDTVVIMQLGYSVDVLAKLPWLAKVKCYYWGDIDTHGFAILNRLRVYLPNVISFMMDEQTLLHHREFWGDEDSQHAAQTLPLLKNDEQLVYQKLKQHFWKNNLRLEQERINWEYAMNIFREHE